MPEFDNGPLPISSATEFEAKGGVHDYVILFGGYNSEVQSPKISMLKTQSSDSSILVIYKIFLIMVSIQAYYLMK